MTRDLPEPDDDDDLRPKTFLERYGFMLLLAAVAVALFAAGLILG